MSMTENARDNLLSSGPARFQLLTAFHPTITSRKVECFGSKLSHSFSRALFETMVKLDVVSAHMRKYCHSGDGVDLKTTEIIKFCRSLAHIYQVFFYFWNIFTIFEKITESVREKCQKQKYPFECISILTTTAYIFVSRMSDNQRKKNANQNLAPERKPNLNVTNQLFLSHLSFQGLHRIFLISIKNLVVF